MKVHKSALSAESKIKKDLINTSYYLSLAEKEVPAKAKRQDHYIPTPQDRKRNLTRAINAYDHASKAFDRLKDPSTDVKNIDWDKIRERIESTARKIEVSITNPEVGCSVFVMPSAQKSQIKKICEPTQWKANKLLETKP